MSWNLAWLLALLLELGSPSFDPEVACVDPQRAASPLCSAGPWAELLPGAAATRARLLYAMAAWHEALGDAASAAKARTAAEEALELALTDRAYAHGWLAEARAALASIRLGPSRAARGDEAPDPSDLGAASPAEERRALAAARDSLRPP